MTEALDYGPAPGADDLPPEEDSGDFWQARDEDRLLDLQVNEARARAAGALMRAVAEIADGFIGEDERDCLLDLPDTPDAIARHFEDTAAKIREGTNETPVRIYDNAQRYCRTRAEWAENVRERMHEIEQMARALYGRASACPADPGEA